MRILVCLSAALLLSACGGGNRGSGNSAPPPSVTVEEVTVRTIPVDFEYPATTAGSREVEIRAQVTGILLRHNYEEGAAVVAGASLFSIDQAVYQAQLANAEGDAAAADARLIQAEREVKRLKPLLDAKAASKKDYDDAVSTRDVAAADLKAAKSRVADAHIRLVYTQVEAPITGITSRALLKDGALISGPDVVLTNLTQIDPIYVNFSISEADSYRRACDVAAGCLVLPQQGEYEVTIRFSDDTAYTTPGKLSFTDVRINPATASADARAELPNPDGRVRPGQYVRVVLKGAYRPNAIAIPQRAVFDSQTGKTVYVVDAEGKAQARPITVGPWSGNDWVVTAGLSAGEKIIVNGLMKVKPGMPVKVVTPSDKTEPVPHGKQG